MRRATTILLLLAMVIWPQAEAARVSEEWPHSLEADTDQTEPLAVVINRMNSVTNLSFDELHRIFLGSRVHWSDGRRITLVMRDPGEPERKTILHDVCGMNENQFKIHFVKGLFTGEILVSPKILSTPAGVRKFIFNVPGAIGYLRLSEVDDSVKVVLIDELSPDDRRYRLRMPLPSVKSE